MNENDMREIFRDLDFVRTGGSPEELRAAEYLAARCEALGAKARIEPFRVQMGELGSASVRADGAEVPCKGVACCGSGEAEGELCYAPATDPVTLAGAKDRIVLLDGQGVGYWAYQDLMRAGAKGILFQYGNVNWPQRDIDERELREAVVGDARKVPCAMIHTADAAALLQRGVKRVSIAVSQREYDGESRNVVAEKPGRRDEWIALTAHYDSTALSRGAYDNLSGCVGLLCVLEALRGEELNYGLRLIFCGSEERGLLGSRAYAEANAAALEKTVLNVNLDMIGSALGKFIARVSAEEALAHYLRYMGAECGFPVAAKTGVYSSDSTSFADKGVPAVSLARIASNNAAPIHCRYDTAEVLRMEQLRADAAFITRFVHRMASAAVCPVGREIPEKVREELDVYLARKRKKED